MARRDCIGSIHFSIPRYFKLSIAEDDVRQQTPPCKIDSLFPNWEKMRWNREVVNYLAGAIAAAQTVR